MAALLAQKWLCKAPPFMVKSFCFKNLKKKLASIKTGFGIVVRSEYLSNLHIFSK